MIRRISACVVAAAATVSCNQIDAANYDNDVRPQFVHKQAVVPEGMEWAPNSLGFSPALISGDLVFVAGEVAVIRMENPDLDTMEKAYGVMFERLGRTLADSGATWDDVVEITTYHTDLPGQIETLMKVKNEYITTPPYPAWTAVDVDRLYPDAGITEMKLIARLRPR